MGNNLMMFESKQVEIFEWNGQILFNPYHVGECLGIKNVRDNLVSMNEKQVIKLKNSDVGNADIRKLNNAGENFLTESGVYKLIFKSRKPEAERFQDWVTDEVLPSIHKQGYYSTQPAIDINALSPELQMFKHVFDSVAQTQIEQKRQQEEIERISDKVESIKEVVALNANNWRKDTAILINKMALWCGGYEHIKKLREESYKLLETRMGVNLGIRLTNKKKTLSLNGAGKSRIDKVTKVDVIGEDKKLIEGYMAIVKEMSIKYGA